MSHHNAAPVCPTCHQRIRHVPEVRQCAECGSDFISKINHQKFCSKKCNRHSARNKPDRKTRRLERQKLRRRTDFAYVMKGREAASCYYQKIARFNPIARIRSGMRKRIRAIIKSTKSLRMQILIGCTGPELRGHLESQFKEGMTWKNYGTHWVVDHRKPLSKFDLTNPEHLRGCCHFSNLQPLTREENSAKAAKWEEPEGINVSTG